ncbi:hypothetical protein GCM10028824_13380 [Hymenobacter segetis]
MVWNRGRGYFAHRLAYPSQRLCYDSQLMPASLKPLIAPLALDRKLADAHMARHKKGRKTHYRGKPTRWYARLQALEAKADRAAFVGLAHTASGRFNPLT